jgi:4'-phosphopantetheinyl transferase
LEEQAVVETSLSQHQPAVWWLRTDHLDDACLERLRATLDPTELARAGRFVSARDRRDFAACHALLRIMLSRITGRLAYEWVFSPSLHGKPSIAAGHGLPDLQFNISHTRGLVAAAVAQRHPVGVDVQIVDASCDQLDLARRFFAAAEAELVHAASASDRPRVFAQLWTLKEAYIKATGVGLSMPLDSFAFDLDRLQVRFRREGADSPAAWQFTSSMVTNAHALSVALHVADQPSPPVNLRQLTGEELQAAIA